MKSNNLLSFTGAAVASFAVLWILEKQDLINPEAIGLSHHSATDTPGWYTLQGHHHCGVSPTGEFAAGCLCTDPKKCFGTAGTGAPYCKAHPEECAPVDKPEWCAYWYASDQKNCNLCTGAWKYTGPDGSGAKRCP